MNLLPHVAGRIFSSPLMISHAKLEVILGVLTPRMQGEALTSKRSIEAKRGYDVTPDGIAILPIFGSLVRRTVGVEAESGLTSYGGISNHLAHAISDPAVRAILLDIDSPGGEASGVFDLADEIFNASSQKHIWAFVSGEAFSAAYALASSAERIYLSRTSGVGSIGVIAVHLDQSLADAEEGLKYTSIFAGNHKDDYSSHKPLADPARASLQKEVNRIYEIFASEIALNREMPLDAIKKTEAALFFGEDAIKAGLADVVAPFDEALDDYSYFLSTTPDRKAHTMTEHEENISNMAQSTAPEVTALQEELLKRAKAEGFAEAKAYMDEVKDLCALAGAPSSADAFIEKTVPLADVRKALLEAKAKQADATEIAGHIPAPTPSGEAKIDTAAIYAARNNLKGA